MLVRYAQTSCIISTRSSRGLRSLILFTLLESPRAFLTDNTLMKGRYLPSPSALEAVQTRACRNESKSWLNLPSESDTEGLKNNTKTFSDSCNEDSTVNVDSKKVLIGIRHGRSKANEWMSQPGNEWGDHTFRDDPSLRDAPLSDAGRLQAIELSARISTLLDLDLQPSPASVVPSSKLPFVSKLVESSETLDIDNKLLLAEALRKVDLVLVSPLTRCLQTYQYGVKPALDQHGLYPKVVALPLLTERVFTCSDTGSLITSLRVCDEFAHSPIDWSEALKMCDAAPNGQWWYTGNASTDHKLYEEWRPHEQGQWYAVPGEPLEIFDDRLKSLQEWIRQRPERCILMVTHWGVIRHLTGQEVENCAMSFIVGDPAAKGSRKAES